MAAANRARLKEARGAKTKHQFRKANRVAKYANNASDRRRELEAWMLKTKEERQVPKGLGNVKKHKRFAMNERTIARRSRALARLKAKPVDARNEQEIHTLIKRGAVLLAA